MKRVREVIQLCLEEQTGDPGSLELVGIQQISVGPAFRVWREKKFSAPSQKQAFPLIASAAAMSS